MVRTKTTVKAKSGTTSSGGLGYTVRSPRKPVFKRQAAQMIQTEIEKKFYDTSFGTTVVPNTGAIFNSLNLVPQGVSDSNRVGNKMVIKNVNHHFTIQLTNQGVSVPQSDKVRIITYVDKQCNGAAANVTDILEAANIHSFRNLDQVDRFEILQDELHELDCYSFYGGGTANAINIGTIKLNKKLNCHINFSGATGAITELRSNNIGFLVISFGNSISTIEGTSRVKFVDL